MYYIDADKVTVSFGKFMEDILAREKRNEKPADPAKRQELTPGQEYQRRYGEHPSNRIYYGKGR